MSGISSACIRISAFIAVLTPCAIAAADTFTVNDRVISDPSISVVDQEVDQGGGRVVWQDLAGNLWLAWLDPDTGAMKPRSGQGMLLDTGLASMTQTLNGPEWAFGNGEANVVYSKIVNGQNHLGAARVNYSIGNWQSTILPASLSEMSVLGSPITNTSDPARITYFKYDKQGLRHLAWRNVYDPSSEMILTDTTTTSARWVEGEPAMVTTVSSGGYHQVAYIDATTGALTQLTFDPTDKFLPVMWWAPEYGEYLLQTMVNTTDIGIYRNIGGVWTMINMLHAPTSKPYVHSPEPFTNNGQSYIFFVTADQLGQGGSFFGTPVGPTEIWIAGIDSQNPFYRRVDDPTQVVNKIDPEVFNTTKGPQIQFTEHDYVPNRFLLHSADSGLPPNP